MPLTRTLGASFSRYDKEEVRARLDWAPGLCTVNGCSTAARSWRWPTAPGVPAPSSTCPSVAGDDDGGVEDQLLRGVREGYIEAVSRPLHIGRTVVVVETDVRDQNDRLVARVTQTQLSSC